MHLENPIKTNSRPPHLTLFAGAGAGGQNTPQLYTLGLSRDAGTAFPL